MSNAKENDQKEDALTLCAKTRVVPDPNRNGHFRGRHCPCNLKLDYTFFLIRYHRISIAVLQDRDCYTHVCLSGVMLRTIILGALGSKMKALIAWENSVTDSIPLFAFPISTCDDTGGRSCTSALTTHVDILILAHM